MASKSACDVTLWEAVLGVLCWVGVKRELAVNLGLVGTMVMLHKFLRSISGLTY